MIENNYRNMIRRAMLARTLVFKDYDLDRRFVVLSIYSDQISLLVDYDRYLARILVKLKFEVSMDSNGHTVMTRGCYRIVLC